MDFINVVLAEDLYQYSAGNYKRANNTFEQRKNVILTRND